MRTLAVGDIHGSFRALETLAAFVPFRPEDQLVTLGDYVDRGPQSREVLDWLIAYPGRLVALRGNHEIMMMEARGGGAELRGWLRCGGMQALESYPSPEGPSLSAVPPAHWDFLENRTVPFLEIDSHFFVHANADEDLPLDEQPDEMLFWEHLDNPRPHCSGKIMVCGHTQQRSGQPKEFRHAVCIDTSAYAQGWLTCLDVGTGRYWQANQRGETRTGQLAGR